MLWQLHTNRLRSEIACIVHGLQWMLCIGCRHRCGTSYSTTCLEAACSALYGVETWHFYFVNGALNFNLALVAALSFPAVAALQAMRVVSTPIHGRLVLATVPLYVWLAAISMLPHKEERFLYVAYPQVCASACHSASAHAQRHRIRI